MREKVSLTFRKHTHIPTHTYEYAQKYICNTFIYMYVYIEYVKNLKPQYILQKMLIKVNKKYFI